MSEAEEEWADLMHESESTPETCLSMRGATTTARRRRRRRRRKMTRNINSVRRARSMILVTVTTQWMIQLIPTKYYHLLVQRRLRQGIRFSNHAQVLRRMRTCRTSLVSRSFMPGTTRTGRDGWRGGCIGATSTCEISLVPPLCDTASR